MIQLYKYNVTDLTQEQYDNWYWILSEQKRQKIDNLRFDKDKKLSVVSDMLIRRAVSEFCGVEPGYIIIKTKDGGKPYAENLNVEFNASHSGEMVVCVVSDKPVGIDIEQIRPVNLKVARRVCSDYELEYIFGHIPKEQEFVTTDDTEVLKRFFEVWTSREAYVKFKGTGIKDIRTDFDKAFISSFCFENYVVSVYCE